MNNDCVCILRHRPSGNLLFSNGVIFVLKKGATVNPTYDQWDYHAVPRIAHEPHVTESGELTCDVLFVSVEHADFFVTGKAPTPESVAEWEPFTCSAAPSNATPRASRP